MASLLYHYVVTVDVPKPLANELLTIRRGQWQDDGPHLNPHITVKKPFSFTGEEEIVREVLAGVAAVTAPFVVHASGLGHFDTSRGYVLYVAVQRSAALHRLHESVVQALAPLVVTQKETGGSWEWEGYIPHITIAAHLPTFDYVALAESLQDYHPVADVTAEAMHLHRKDQDDPWAPWEWQATWRLTGHLQRGA